MKCCICEKEKKQLNVVNKFNGNKMCAGCALGFGIIDKATYDELKPTEESEEVIICEKCAHDLGVI